MSLYTKTKSVNLPRNETEYPPCLNSVHVSTHPNKKSKDTSRFIQPTSPNKLNTSQHKKVILDPPTTVSITSSDKEVVQCQIFGNTGLAPSHKSNCSIAKDRRACCFLKTPKKATKDVLLTRTYHDYFRPATVQNSLIVNNVHEISKEKFNTNISNNNRLSLEGSAGTFSFGACDSIEKIEDTSRIPPNIQTDEVVVSSNKTNLNNHSGLTKGFSVDSQMVHIVKMKPPMIIDTKNILPNHPIEKLTVENLNQFTHKTTSAEENTILYGYKSTLSNDCKTFGTLQQSYTVDTNQKTAYTFKNQSVYSKPISFQDSRFSSHTGNDHLTTLNNLGKDTLNKNVLESVLKPPSEKGLLGRDVSTKSSTPECLERPTKPSFVIMCQVPATGEALLNKPLALKAPSRRSIIPRKAPRPPTTGFLCDEPQENSRYYRYFREFENDENQREVKRRHKIQNESGNEITSNICDTSPARLVKPMNPRSLWSAQVVLSLSNERSNFTKKTRTHAVAFSLEGEGIQNTFQLQNYDNHLEIVTTKALPHTEQTEAYKKQVCKVFNLSAGIETSLSPVIVGTHTCAWFWDILTSENLWAESQSQTNATLQHIKRNNPLSGPRSLYNYVVLLLTNVVNRLQTCVNLPHESNMDVKISRQAQEHHILMTVVRDVLKAWSDASVKLLDKQVVLRFSSLSVSPSLKQEGLNNSFTNETVVHQRNYLNKLVSSYEYLKRVENELNGQALTSPSTPVLTLDQFLQYLKTSCQRVLTQEPNYKDFSDFLEKKEKLLALKDSLLNRVQKRKEEKNILQYSLIKSRLENWIAVLTLYTLKTLHLYIKTRRGLRCTTDQDVLFRNSTRLSFSKSRNSASKPECESASYLRRPSLFDTSFDDINEKNNEKAFSSRNSINRLSIISYASYDEPIPLSVSHHDNDKMYSTPQHKPVCLQSSNQLTKEESAPFLDVGHPFLRSSQRRRRKTTLGYTLRLQKHK